MNNWIWLDAERHPDKQTCAYTGNWESRDGCGVVVELSRRYGFGKKIEKIELRYSSDSVSQLWVNKRFIGTGPVWVGGDFLGNERPRQNRYATELTCVGGGEDDYQKKQITVDGLGSGTLEFLARVRLSPVQICEFSVGRGGFMLGATVYFADGENRFVSTDESWDAVICPEYSVAGEYDGRRSRAGSEKAVTVDDVWHATASPLPLRVEKRCLPIGEHIFTLGAGESRTVRLEYDKIYAAYTSVGCKCEGEVEISLMLSEAETDSVPKTERYVFVTDGEYIGTRLYSVGRIIATVTNRSNADATVDISINEAYLPSVFDARTVTSDEGLNKILEACRHTLKYCRQYIHLDSPKHCEPSACTGDYFVETMMTAFSFGDMALADFDAVRTARSLEHNGGVMFHPTYSLIWARMVYEVYMRTGRMGLLKECEEALGLLLSTFAGYVGECGLVDTPPSYMFVDWIVADGYSLHHPPKALGQGVMNMFYYDALRAASEIYGYLGKDTEAQDCAERAERLRESINAFLYDTERRMYCEGLNTPTPAELIGYYMPENSDKRYFRINTNALAVAFGVIEGDAATDLLDRILGSGEYEDYQPYFAHFLLSAVHRAGLDGRYLHSILDKWRAPVAECDKGLAEGFIPPEPTYSFDHSHAWGGTPLYSLPMALTSLEILEPGMSRLAVTPRLLGLDYATVEIPTPQGTVRIDVDKERGVSVTAPDGVTVTVR